MSTRTTTTVVLLSSPNYMTLDLGHVELSESIVAGCHLR